MSRPRPLALVAATALGVLALTGAPALAQEEPPASTGSTTSTTAPPDTTPSTPDPDTSSTTTTTTVPADPDDPAIDEELPPVEVPVVDDPVPPRADGDTGESAYGIDARRILRQQLHVTEAETVELTSDYEAVRARVAELEAKLDKLEASVTGLAADDRAAVRRVEAARRQFEARAVSALVHGRSDDIENLLLAEDPNDLAVARTLLGSVLEADDAAVREYLAAKEFVRDDLVGVAERLVDARLSLETARAQLVEARRAVVAAQFDLAVFAAGSEIVIHGFVFPVGDPHTFGDSFGAPRMMGTGYEHAHHGTDIMAPAGTPLVACERGIVTEMGNDVLGGTTLWIKGESGTYYYYAHLSAFEEGLAAGAVVEAGEPVGLVGDTGNARGGAPHLHFEIHPDGGMAVNPYPLLKVVDDLSQQAKARTER